MQLRVEQNEKTDDNNTMNYLHGYGGLLNDTSGVYSEEAIFSQACHLGNWKRTPRQSAKLQRYIFLIEYQ